MSQNPLQQYFRQPKLYVALPSKASYNKLGSFQGDATNVPICSMTGADEILMKTPDALLTGETTVKIFESCCSAIKDGWEVSSLDTDLLLTAIRIASTGNIFEVHHVCPQCEELNEYDIDLTTVIDHYENCKYINKVVLSELTVKLQPLTYRKTSEFSLKNFRIQKQLRQTTEMADEDQKKQKVNELFKELSDIQQEIFTESIESVETGSTVVTERSFIKEWLNNCDKSVFDSIKNVFNENKENWRIPLKKVKCNECGKETEVAIELDQSSFFGNA